MAFIWGQFHQKHFSHQFLTPKHQETHGCVVSTVVTDALVLKHQAISIHNADQMFILFHQFRIKKLHLWWTTLENKITFWKKWPSRLRVNICLKMSFLKFHTNPPGSVGLTHWLLGHLEVALEMQMSFLFYWVESSALFMTMPSYECHRNLLMKR